MKVYINRFPINGPWGGGNMFVKAFHKHVPEMGHDLIPPESMSIAPDAVLLAGLDNDGQGGVSAEQAIMYKMYQDRVKLVLRVNENDARKGTAHVDDYLLKLAPHMDGTVFVSHWLRDYFLERGWPDNNHAVIVNGVDREIFKSQPKLNNGKLNIVAHHWSDNPLKGFDIYEQLDEFVGANSDKYAFTYIGRDRRTFKHTNVVRPLFGKKLGEELGKHDVYVSASRFDPGPNHVLEALACDMPTYVHKDGGGCVEFAGYAHAYGTWEELRDILESGPPYHANVQSNNLHTWPTCVREYIGFLEATCKTPNPSQSDSTSS
jgi:glycosyltransferase involved in cell wall biosynthesis